VAAVRGKSQHRTELLFVDFPGHALLLSEQPGGAKEKACGTAAAGYGERMTERLFLGLAFIAIGVVVIVNRETDARNTVEFQNRWFRRRQGAREVSINRRVYLLVGVGFIVWGLGYAISGV
jgi:hypothetical protein